MHGSPQIKTNVQDMVQRPVFVLPLLFIITSLLQKGFHLALRALVRSDTVVGQDVGGVRIHP